MMEPIGDEEPQLLGMPTRPDALNLPAMERRRWLISIICCIGVVAILFVALRLFSRRLMRQKIWWDDYLIIFALTSFGADIILTGILISFGLGRHLVDVPPFLLPTTNKIHLAAQLLYQWSMMAAKTSILLMYYRIFKIMPYFRAAASVVFTLVLFTALVFSFIYPFRCYPQARLFDPTIPGKCFNPIVVGITNGSINILTDVLTLCLPFPQVWKLPLKRMEKITVSIAFALGLFVVFASSYRIYVLKNYDPRDNTYGLVPLFGWSLIDCFAAILSACLPVLKPVLLFLLDKLHLSGERGLLSKYKKERQRRKAKERGDRTVDTTISTEHDSTLAASCARKSFSRTSYPGVGGLGIGDGGPLDYMEARRKWSCTSDNLRGSVNYSDVRRHWSATETLRGDLADLDDDDMEAAMHFQTKSAWKSDF